MIDRFEEAANQLKMGKPTIYKFAREHNNPAIEQAEFGDSM